MVRVIYHSIISIFKSNSRLILSTQFVLMNRYKQRIITKNHYIKTLNNLYYTHKIMLDCLSFCNC